MRAALRQKKFFAILFQFFFDMSMISSKKPFMMTLRLMIYLATIDVLYVKKMPILALF